MEEMKQTGLNEKQKKDMKILAELPEFAKTLLMERADAMRQMWQSMPEDVRTRMEQGAEMAADMAG